MCKDNTDVSVLCRSDKGGGCERGTSLSLEDDKAIVGQVTLWGTEGLGYSKARPAQGENVDNTKLYMLNWEGEKRP